MPKQMHNVIYSMDNVIYTYNLLDCYFNKEGLMNTAGTIRGLLCAHIAQAKADHLDREIYGLWHRP
jgi:hypothetical protein